MKRKIRTAPIAIFLLVIMLVISVLAVLTFVTSRADLVMAERYADVTQIRYALEASGEEFLHEAAIAAKSGKDIASIDGVEHKKGGYVFEKRSGGYRLEAEISEPDSDGSFNVRSFRISREWQYEEPAGLIWEGN